MKRGKKTEYLIKLRYLGHTTSEEEAHQLLDQEDITKRIKSTSASWIQLTFKDLNEGLEFMKEKASELSRNSNKRSNLILIGSIPW